MTHLLPGGGAPQVHGAGSPVPSPASRFRHSLISALFNNRGCRRLPSTPPPDAWSPRLPAQPGPCYWLVASGTPMGWRRGCLAMGLVRSTFCYYCLGGCSAQVVCTRHSQLCVLPWCGRACCCLLLCLVPWLFWAVSLCGSCPPRSVRCCALLCWCACVVLFECPALFPAPGPVVHCCVLCCCLWCAVARCWVWLSASGFWWRVSVSVSVSDHLPCFPVVGVFGCGALHPCAVFRGAVLSFGAKRDR